MKQAGEPDRTYYAHTDHLGSIVKLTDNNGNPVFQASYDAWGLQTLSESNTFSFHRGYTGHEHLPDFGLINMNGRMYHPVLGRFLSPDPYVQAPEYSQNFNRYSYCLNNPLVYTDPSGEFIFTALAAFFSQPLLPAAIQLDMAWMQGGLMEMGNGGNFWSGAGKGFVTGLAYTGLSFLNIPGAIPNGLLHSGGNVLINGISNTLNEQNFFDGWYLPAASGLLSGGYSGHKMANKMGLNPWTGGLKGQQKSLWNAYKNGIITLEELTMCMHGEYYFDAGDPEIVLGNSKKSRGSYVPLDENGNKLGIVEASRNYTSVKGRITMHPAGMTSGRRFLFTSYHELTHAQMFYNGDMHNQYNFLAMNYNTGIKTSLSKQMYFQAGLKIYTERWAYGAQWARWRINGSRINYVNSTWQQMLKLSPTVEGAAVFKSLFESF